VEAWSGSEGTRLQVASGSYRVRRFSSAGVSGPRSFSYRNPAYPKGGAHPGRVREAQEYSYADEDQSVRAGLRPGVRVRHAQFGGGVVLSVEELDDDLKLQVRFNAVGQKTLRARYAKLEPAG